MKAFLCQAQLPNNSLNTGAADDTITVSETHAHVTQGTFINAGAGDDTFIIGSAANGLDNIATFVTLDGQAGTNTLRVDDTKGKAGKGVYKINKAKAAGEGNLRKIAAPGTPFIEFKNITTAPVPNGKSLTFLGRETGSEIQLAGLWAGMSFEYVGNVGADKLTLASDTSILDDVLASISFLGDGGTDTLVVQDGNYGAGERYSINKDTLSIARSSFLNLAWSNVEEMFLTSGPGSDRISLSNLTPTLNLHLDGGSAVDDRVVIAQGVVSTPQVSFANIETLEITNGTLDLGSSVAFLRYEQSGGVLKGSATLTVQNQGDWTGGASTGLGTSVFAAGSTLTITSPATKTLDDRTVELYGTTTWDQGPIAPDSSGGPGTLHNEPGATFSGTGVFTGNFINDGTLQPGSAAATGVVAVHGDFAQTGTGLLSIGLGGPGGSDQLVVAGHVAIAGALGVTLLPGFNPSVGASFTVLDNQGLDPVSGTFAGLPQGATLSVAGWLLQLSYTGGTGNDVTLTVLATAPITLALSSNPSFYGQPVTLTATLAANASVPPTGTVSFYDGTVLLGSGPVTQGPLGSTASFVTSTLSLGNHSITATYGGDSNYPSSTSAALIETVQKDASTVGLSADHSTSVVGQTVNFTATVTPASYGAHPSGTVSFYDGSSLLGTVPLSQGMLGSQATFSTSALSLGNHSIKAVYNGDSYFTASTSWLLTETVQQATTSTYLSASSNPSYGGQAVTFTASISSNYVGTPPTGTVSFFDGTTLLGTGTLGAGGMGAQATFITSTLALGSHSITAVYGGDATYLTSTSSAVTETVQQPTTSTTLSESISSSYPGQAVTFTASVSSMGGGGTPTGTVSFFDGTTLLGTGTLGAGGMGAQATFITSTLALGSHSITAAYGGDSTYAGSTSSAVTETVQQATPSVGLSASPQSAYSGQAVTFTASVSSTVGAPTGSVSFFDGTTLLGTGTLGAGGMGAQATFITSTLALGSHSITAAYGGDSTYASVTSSVLTETVSQPMASVGLSASTPTSSFGQAVTFTATVTPPPSGATPTGSVTFYDGTAALGTVTLSTGMGGTQAAFTTSTLGVGSHSITAVYGGDATYAGGTSPAVTETVQQASTATTSTSLSSSAQTAFAGQAVTFTATVTRSGTGATPTGTLTFYDGNVSIGSAAVSPYMGMGGQAVLTLTTLAVGSHSITAVYSGDGTCAGSTSTALSETVQRASVMAMISTSNSSAMYGQAVTFTATVYPNAQGVAPTGTISFYDGSTLLATISLSQVGGNYQAAFTTSTLSRGSHTIVAVYSGDQDFTGNSASVGETIS